MKKYFLMLVVALVMPLVFTSCGDDDPTDEPSKFPYSLPVLNWGVSQASVKSSMANSGYDLSFEGADGLVYSAGENFPMYTYLFNDNNELYSSSLALSDAQDTQYDFQGFLEEKYGEAFKEDETHWYYDAGNSIVSYGYVEIEGADVWMATWAAVETRSDISGVEEAKEASLELVKKARNQK